MSCANAPPSTWRDCLCQHWQTGACPPLLGFAWHCGGRRWLLHEDVEGAPFAGGSMHACGWGSCVPRDYALGLPGRPHRATQPTCCRAAHQGLRRLAADGAAKRFCEGRTRSKSYLAEEGWARCQRMPLTRVLPLQVLEEMSASPSKLPRTPSRSPAQTWTVSVGSWRRAFQVLCGTAYSCRESAGIARAGNWASASDFTTGGPKTLLQRNNPQCSKQNVTECTAE